MCGRQKEGSEEGEESQRRNSVKKSVKKHSEKMHRCISNLDLSRRARVCRLT